MLPARIVVRCRRPTLACCRRPIVACRRHQRCPVPHASASREDFPFFFSACRCTPGFSSSSSPRRFRSERRAKEGDLLLLTQCEGGVRCLSLLLLLLLLLNVPS
jgi:hypothetical protein